MPRRKSFRIKKYRFYVVFKYKNKDGIGTGSGFIDSKTNKLTEKDLIFIGNVIEKENNYSDICIINYSLV